MHALAALVLTFAGSALAAPALTERSTEQENFVLRVADNQGLNGWSVLEAHVSAGTNAIEIQRPAAFQPEKVHLFGTTREVNNGEAQLFSRKSTFNTHARISRGCSDIIALDKAAGSEYSWVLPSPPAGQVAQVFSELGTGTDNWGTRGNTAAGLRLIADGSPHGTCYECRIEDSHVVDC